MRYAAAVFDLDGTLVDSAPALVAIGSAYLAERGAAPLGLDDARRFIGEGARRFLERMLAARDLPADPAAVAAAYPRFHAIYEAGPPEDNVMFDGVRAVLAGLAAAGMPLGLCTNKPGAPTRKLLATFGLEATFAVVMTGDDPPLKPDPAPLLKAATVLGATPATTLYVGDSDIDARTAAAAGCDFALHLGGYHNAPAGTAAPAFTFARFAELEPILLAHRA